MGGGWSLGAPGPSGERTVSRVGAISGVGPGAKSFTKISGVRR